MFSAVKIIEKKRDKKELSPAEIQSFVDGLSDGSVADYQASAFLMAVYLNGMTLSETVAMTRAMLNSGERYDLASVRGPKVDKHSTGGVGDKVSLILAPLAAACGLRVPMMSGRGLGHTGGTLDKLEAINGFNVKLNRSEFETILNRVGCAMIGQSELMVPADKKLYALRDVTGTVECIPLITSSILSKKIAEGAQGLVLDVKVGSGAFMKDRTRARRLATTLKTVANKMKLNTRAVLSNMNQPLGCSVGHRVEVEEAIRILKNQAPDDNLPSQDLKEITIHLCSQMLMIGKKARNLNQARKMCRDHLENGSAWSKFEKMVTAQSGSVDKFLKNSPLKTIEWKASKKGFVQSIDAESIGHIVADMGGGRKKTTDTIDLDAGIIFHKKVGSYLKKGEPIASVTLPHQTTDLDELKSRFDQAVIIGNSKKKPRHSVLETL